MSPESWKFYIEYWDPWPTLDYFEYVGKVFSFSGDVARKSYLDQYSGTTYQITIENNNDEAAQLVRVLTKLLLKTTMTKQLNLSEVGTLQSFLKTCNT